eukprot:TRINITY_DN19704_c0_g1_i1.p2 TRINITY_DN19704_c0_g1~~TRINITY_DN19704_c0_g1_i1.p2  ORF type:complete len:187 (+),score=19.00 TRINITY_DN19704_c0_g1_i1:38-562(+)
MSSFGNVLFSFQSWFKFALTKKWLAPYHATPYPVVHKLLQLAQIQRNDLVMDLGCGDGRVLIESAKKYGTQGIGYELDASLAEEATKNVLKNNVNHLVQIVCEDARKAPVEKAHVLVCILTESGNSQLLDQIEQRINPQTKVLSFIYPIAKWKPEQTMRHSGIDLYLYKKVNQQ